MSSESLWQCKCKCTLPQLYKHRVKRTADQFTSSTLYWIKDVPGRRQIKSGFESSGSVPRRCRILSEAFFERAARWTRVIEEAEGASASNIAAVPGSHFSTSRGITDRPRLLLNTFYRWKYISNNMDHVLIIILFCYDKSNKAAIPLRYTRFVLCYDVVMLYIMNFNLIIQRASFTSAQNVSYHHHPQAFQLVSWSFNVFSCGYHHVQCTL